MSYLDTPRLVFSGDFLSDVSTINNITNYYNNATFQSDFQGKDGLWNPEGGAVFNFQECTVHKMVYSSGKEETESKLVGQLVTGAEGRTTGKMVDLDPQEQGSSELWAVQLRILTSKDELILEGNLDTTAFRDLQRRQSAGIRENGQPLGGTWTTVLTNITWGKASKNHPFFKELKSSTDENTLSVNLNAFGYYYQQAENGRFSLGKMLGAIGPWFKNDPKTFAPCRRLYGIANQGTPQRPAVYFSNTNFKVDESKSTVTVDFGSSFPVINSLGTVGFQQPLYLAVSHQALSNNVNTHGIQLTSKDLIENYTMIGRVPYEPGRSWLFQTSGIVTLDLPQEAQDYLVGNESTSDPKINPHQLVLITSNERHEMVIIAREAIDGYLVRADNFVQRLDAYQSNTVHFYGYQWGKPLSSRNITVTLQPPTPVVPQGPNNPICDTPGNNYPKDGVSYPSVITTNEKGKAEFLLTGNKIHNPRGYIDGQIYTFDYQLQNISNDPAIGIYSNDNVFLHLRNYFEVPEQPVWDDIAEIMIQFSNLYPIMSKYIVDLSDPEAVITKKDILIFAFSRPIEDPMYMPVTRDLSASKKETILKWLANPILHRAEKMAIKANTNLLMESPAATSQQLTESQEKLKMAVRAKSGDMILFEDLDQLKY